MRDNLGIQGEDLTYTQFESQDAGLYNEAALRANPSVTPAVIPLAKLTPGGANGSITINEDGVIIAYVIPT